MAKKSPKTTLVFLTGTAWAALLLLAVFMAESRGILIMGRFAKLAIPYAAALAGMAAGSGYYLMSRRFGVHPSAKFVTGIVVTGLVLFGLFQAGLFQQAVSHDGYQGGFITWIQQTVEQSTLTIGHGQQKPIVLGYKGYIYLMLEMIGFAIGLAIPPLCQSESAFCSECGIYMNKQDSRFLHGECTTEKVKSQAKSSWKEVSLNAFENLRFHAENIYPALTNHQAREALAWLETLPTQLDPNQVAAWEFALARCSGCGSRHAFVRHHFLDVSSKVDNLNHASKLETQIFIPAALLARG